MKTRVYNYKDFKEIDRQSYRYNLEAVRGRARIKRNRKEKKLNSESFLKARKIERMNSKEKNFQNFAIHLSSNQNEDDSKADTKALFDKEYFHPGVCSDSNGEDRKEDSKELQQRDVRKNSFEENKGDFEEIFVPFPEEEVAPSQPRMKLSTREVSIPPNTSNSAIPDAPAEDISREEVDSMSSFQRINPEIPDENSLDDFEGFDLDQLANNFESFHS
ncbi:unnamed protein product [Moneuplotes crassus]|uniref:Uncharacterized protein n=1 Tax=Euplotes crassus TaxID=5936 RepID=A0AAD2D9E0_EUPCR|nr:unnamed protein product [Moneuplotes crassus]